MKKVVLNLPVLGLAVATRAAIGAGIGLLAAERLPRGRRRNIGIALIALGAVTTVPILKAVLRGSRGEPREALPV